MFDVAPLNDYSLTTLVTSFEATYLYQYTFILLYNLVFTSLPVIVLGGSFFICSLAV